MLRLLLDEHLSPTLARQVLAHRPDVAIVSLNTWEDGVHRGDPDPVVLSVARAQGLTLVTYDQRTIVPLLKVWGEQGTVHGGVIFIDERTLAPSDFGGLMRALVALWDAHAEEDWADRVIYLTSS